MGIHKQMFLRIVNQLQINKRAAEVGSILVFESQSPAPAEHFVHLVSLPQFSRDGYRMATLPRFVGAVRLIHIWVEYFLYYVL